MALIVAPRQRPGILPPEPQSGLVSGLQQLLQGKLERMSTKRATQQTATGLQALGIPKEKASQIAMLSPELQSVVVKGLMTGAQSSQDAGIGQQISDIFSDQEQTGLQQAGLQEDTQQQEQPQDLSEMLGSLGAGRTEPMSDQDILRNVLSSDQQVQPIQQPEPQPAPQPVPKVKAPVRRKSADSDQVRKLKKAIAIPGLNEKQRSKFMDQLQKQIESEKKDTALERREKRKEQVHIDSDTKDFYKETNKIAREAKVNERRLGRLEQLTRKGKLDSPLFSSLLDVVGKGVFGFGMNLDSLRSPDSQEFKKLSVEFLKGAKAIFGARVTQKEMEMFMKMVPTLIQSDKGKMRVINNMNAYSKAEMIRKTTMDRLIKENNGNRPKNLESLVESAIEPQLDRLAQAFKKGYNIKAEPEDKSSVVTKYLKGGIFKGGLLMD